MLTAEEVETNGTEVKQDFPTLEELDKQLNDRKMENARKCSDELTALLDKYKMRLSCLTVVNDGKLERNEVIIIPK